MASVITAERIADLIEQAPGWALVALTVPQESLRADARREIAEHVYSAFTSRLTPRRTNILCRCSIDHNRYDAFRRFMVCRRSGEIEL